MRKVLYLITVIHIIFQVVYVTIGRMTTKELGMLRYVFYIFRPEYMIVSGFVAFFVGCGVLMLIIKSVKNMRVVDVMVLLLNLEYILYHFVWLIKQ